MWSKGQKKTTNKSKVDETRLIKRTTRTKKTNKKKKGAHNLQDNTIKKKSKKEDKRFSLTALST